MKCSKCKSNIDKNDKYCSNCGNSNYNDNSLAIVSIVVGIISFLGGFIFFPLPILGLVLALYQKGKSSEKTIGIIINSIALFFVVVAFGIVISLISFGINHGKELIDVIKEDVEVNDDYDVLDGTWKSKDFKIRMYNNRYEKTNTSLDSSDGIYIVYDISKSEIDEAKLNDIKKLVDGQVVEEDMYYVVMAGSNENSREIWLKIEDKDEYFVYSLDSDTYTYYDKEYE